MTKPSRKDIFMAKHGDRAHIDHLIKNVYTPGGEHLLGYALTVNDNISDDELKHLDKTADSMIIKKHAQAAWIKRGQRKQEQ